MTPEKYRKISIWMLRIVVAIMSTFTLLYFMLEKKILSPEIWDEPIFLASSGFVTAVAIIALGFILVLLYKVFTNQQERKSLLNTSLLFFTNLPIIAIYVILIVSILLFTGGIYQD